MEDASTGTAPGVLVSLVVATDVAAFLVSWRAFMMVPVPVWIDGFVIDKRVVGNVKLSVSLATTKESDQKLRFGSVCGLMTINW